MSQERINDYLVANCARIVEILTSGFDIPYADCGRLSLLPRYVKKVAELELGQSQEVEEEIQRMRAQLYNDSARIYWQGRLPNHLKKWYPGGASEGGFLGWGENLEEVLVADKEVVDRLGYNFQTVAMMLKEILDTNNNIAPDGFTLERNTCRGFQNCPFDGCQYGRATCPHAHLDFQLTNTRTGDTVKGPGMIWHLIADHGFFEGVRSPYRVEPEALIKVLFG